MQKAKPSVKVQTQKVIIIGATSGIGRELAKVYVRRGFQVGISGRRQQLLDSLQKKIPGKIITECFDVTGKENIFHLRNMIEKLAGVDIIIYNAGYREISETLNWDIEKQTTDVSVNGFVEIVCYAFNYFVNQGYGHIACTSSIASNRGSAYASAYNASKAYESNYMEGLYLKAKKQKLNISVTDIQPGFVNTAMAKGDKKFWVASPLKAAQQIFNAIKHKKKIAYITKRWWLIAVLIKYLPRVIYNKI